MDDKKFIEHLLNVIDIAYWKLEVGDRVGALIELSKHAVPSSSSDNHWIHKIKQT